jgi:hypothetical protein
MRDWHYRLGVALGVILFLGLTIGAVSLAQHTSPQIAPGEAALIPGAQGVVTVSGFRAGERVTLIANINQGEAPSAALGDYGVPADGMFTALVAIPEVWADGTPVTLDGLTLQAISTDGTSIATLPLDTAPAP